MRKLMTGLCIALGLTMASQAKAETTECTEITSIPTVITVQGVYCLKRNLATAITIGIAIEIATNNVTIDFNGFKLGGLAAGPGTTARGVFAIQQRNIVLRNGSIRGFQVGISLFGDTTNSSGHVIEDMILDNNTTKGIQVGGTGMVIRNNRIVNTGPGAAIFATGITVQNSSTSVIEGNLITNTNETERAVGITIDNSTLIEVRENSILETIGTLDEFGIHLINVTDATILSNRIKNTATQGTRDIRAVTSTAIDCIGNIVRGFSNRHLDCDYRSGEHLP